MGSQRKKKYLRFVFYVLISRNSLHILENIFSCKLLRILPTRVLIHLCTVTWAFLNVLSIHRVSEKPKSYGPRSYSRPVGKAIWWINILLPWPLTGIILRFFSHCLAQFPAGLCGNWLDSNAYVDSPCPCPPNPDPFPLSSSSLLDFPWITSQINWESHTKLFASVLFCSSQTKTYAVKKNFKGKKKMKKSSSPHL